MLFLNEKKERVRSAISANLHRLYRHKLYISEHFLFLSFFNSKKLKLYKQPVFIPFRKLPEMPTYPWLSHNRAMLPSAVQYSQGVTIFQCLHIETLILCYQPDTQHKLLTLLFLFLFFFLFFLSNWNIDSAKIYNSE